MVLRSLENLSSLNATNTFQLCVGFNQIKNNFVSLRFWKPLSIVRSWGGVL